MLHRAALATLVGLGFALTSYTARGECSPVASNRPVCPSSASNEDATFLDPTATIDRPANVRLDPRCYVGPFANFDARLGVVVGAESNVQDSAEIRAEGGPVVLGERVIVAHGARVLGPALLGPEDPDPSCHHEEEATFLGFNSFVDGAVVEHDAMVMHLARVAPGITVPRGRVVLPGKNVETQAEAEDCDLGKVVPITDALRLFMQEVLHVNTTFAREYTRLAREDESNVSGINFNPGHSDFAPMRHLPTLDGQPVQDPGYRNRIIGDARLDDSLADLESPLRVGEAVSIRADEGQPFWIGAIARVSDHATFHALEHTTIRTGDGVSYGRHAIVHGGESAATKHVPTSIGSGSSIGDFAVVFRSVLGRDVEVGCGSLVDGSTLPRGSRVPPLTVVLNLGHKDPAIYPVEWNPGCDLDE
jgi:carbonic anhydrase/acetyltransferase-like protein (isoleucine patch superfamily)